MICMPSMMFHLFTTKSKLSGNYLFCLQIICKLVCIITVIVFLVYFGMSVYASFLGKSYHLCSLSMFSCIFLWHVSICSVSRSTQVMTNHFIHKTSSTLTIFPALLLVYASFYPKYVTSALLHTSSRTSMHLALHEPLSRIPVSVC
jgi:hypothetical protein